VLADHDVNVEGQILRTHGEYGYLLTDVGVDYPQQVLGAIRAMSHTVRLRVLQ
jgi:D-3-phosphoglycerate dehydrogenase